MGRPHVVSRITSPDCAEVGIGSPKGGGGEDEREECGNGEGAYTDTSGPGGKVCGGFKVKCEVVIFERA